MNNPQQLIQGNHITIGENTMGDKGDNINFSGNGNIALGKDNSTVNQTNSVENKRKISNTKIIITLTTFCAAMVTILTWFKIDLRDIIIFFKAYLLGY